MRAFAHRVTLGADADRRRDTKPAIGVLARLGKRLLFRDVLNGDEAAQSTVAVDDRQLLDLGLLQDAARPREIGSDRCGDQAFRRHHGGDCDARIVVEAQVTVRDDANEAIVGIDDGDAGDVEVAHQLERLGDGSVGTDLHRVLHHAGLRAFHPVDLFGLAFGSHVAVDRSEAAKAGERHRHPGFGDRVHRRRHERDAQVESVAELCRRVDLVGQDVGVLGEEQHVVEGEGDIGGWLHCFTGHRFEALLESQA